ncbi:transmembrane protein 127-like [Elysia marginata]|uniref:Transmembrane protein 127-like n=1 Tax=Elysia marginata TaxID=1093978 RepID=A0AAV4JBH3_9GAST|nr:transmembrane protein 127-like [Elysia marginata]
MSDADQEDLNRMDHQIQASGLPPPVVVTGGSRSSSREPGSSHRSSRREHRHRSRSSGRRTRSRSRHSSRRESHSSCRTYCKQSDRNFCAAAFSMFTIVLLCTSLEPEWISLRGGRCREIFKEPGSLRSLSSTQFFYNGHFYKSYSMSQQDDTVYKFGTGSYNFMVNCVTYPVVLLFKSCIAFTFLAVIASFCAFLLDLIAPKYQLLCAIRKNAILNILTALLCMLINMFTYWITVYVDKLQQRHPLHEGSKVVVTFGVSFYLITFAGFFSVMGTASVCLRKRPLQHHRSCARSCDYPVTLDDTEALLSSLAAPEESSADTQDVPPPPPYTV